MVSSGIKRQYRQINMGTGVIQYHVITAVGFHWRHIAVVTVTNGKALKAERYFYSTRAPEVILPFEVMGKDYLINVLISHRKNSHVSNL
jgi:hypothetical protein